jgi:hypothetical protein
MRMSFGRGLREDRAFAYGLPQKNMLGWCQPGIRPHILQPSGPAWHILEPLVNSRTFFFLPLTNQATSKAKSAFIDPRRSPCKKNHGITGIF